MLAGCTAEHHATNATAADIDAAAQAAQGDIDTYAANTLETAAPAATTVPKAAPEPARHERAAAVPAPLEAALATNRQALLTDTGGEVRPCVDKSVVQPVGQTRVTGRVDDAEFDRPDRDAPARRATADVWRKGDGQTVSAGREVGEQSADPRCVAN